VTDIIAVPGYEDQVLRLAASAERGRHLGRAMVEAAENEAMLLADLEKFTAVAVWHPATVTRRSPSATAHDAK
jgi:hypothetical protein